MAEHGPPQQDSLLIVDDDAVGREGLKRRFERHGFSVTDTGNGGEALSLIQACRFDLILLDIEMPGIDGFEVLRAIRTLHSATDLPVIMITAKDQGQDTVQALQLGANDYITKPLDFSVVLARVQTQLSLNTSTHLLGVFRAQFGECLHHFFPGCTLRTLEDGELVRWRERPPNAYHRLGDTHDRAGLGVEWLRSRYLVLPERDPLTGAEKRLIEVLIQVLDTRYRALFDLDMPNRLDLVHHAVEDWGVAEYLWPQNAMPVLEGLELLRVAALLTYENRRVSTGILLTTSSSDAAAPAESCDRSLRLGRWLFQVKSLQRLCDGLHTLFLANSQGFLQGVVEIGQWSRQHQGDAALPGPCPRPYVHHARATLDGKNICLVLTPAQEIKVFASGTLMFAFRGARWHLLDLPAKFASWCRALESTGCRELPRQVFQAAIDLAEARHGALFVVLDDPDSSLDQLVSPADRLSNAECAEASQPRLLQQVLQMTLQEASVTTFGLHILEALSTIDGAVVMDRAGRVLAAGAILRVGAATGRDDKPLEGARATAAAAASHYGPVLKVSEDGVVSFFRHGQAVWHL